MFGEGTLKNEDQIGIEAPHTALVRKLESTGTAYDVTDNNAPGVPAPTSPLFEFPRSGKVEFPLGFHLTIDPMNGEHFGIFQKVVEHIEPGSCSCRVRISK